MTQEIRDILSRGGVGLASLAGGYGFSLTLVREWAQTASVLVGLLIGIVTLIGMIRTQLHKRKGNAAES
jgi:L-cystine uptake protein TcyP (sodium:dicarboxylate symporter family)